MYAKIENNAVSKFPYSMADLYKDHPNTSFPSPVPVETLAEFGVYEVVQTPAPTVDSKTHRQMQEVKQVNEVWTQVWTVQQLAEDKAATNVRGYRDSLLVKSDWTQVADAPVDKVAWAAYRQALRDVTAQAGFPWDIEWPVAP